MTNTPQIQKLQPHTENKIDKLGLGVFLYAYAVLLGASYLFAFWRAIGFNIFPYLSLQDYLSAPLNRVIALIAIPVFMTLIFFQSKITSHTKEYKNVSLYLLMVYAFGFANQQYESISRFLDHAFYHRNEINVFVITFILFLSSLVLAIHIYKSGASVAIQALALILIQTALSMSAGYSDGKGIYNGVAESYSLDNNEICSSNSVDNWVYLGKYSDHTFFIHSEDKRLCLSEVKNLKLESRQFKEKL